MIATEEKPVQILELFGGIGSPRCALRNLGIPTKAIDYVEIDEKAVRSYNNMFSEELPYKTQSVVGWNLKPDILIHGSPCQDFSIAGHQRGADEGSETRSSLMWETIHIIEQMGQWKPQYIIWENVKNVKSKHMIANFVRYQKELEQMGYTNNYEVLDAREFGLPQARERVFTISCLKGEKFNFDDLIRTPMQDIRNFLEDNESVPEVYDVTQPSVRNVIGQTGIKRATVIKDYAFTITTDKVPEGALDTDADGNVPTFDADGNQVGTATPEEIKAAEEAVTENIDGVPAVRIKGKIRRVFNGSIRIRKTPSWSNDAVRGATAFTEKIVTHVMEVDGKPMYKTLDGYFISGDPKLVEYIEE